MISNRGVNGSGGLVFELDFHRTEMLSLSKMKTDTEPWNLQTEARRQFGLLRFGRCDSVVGLEQHEDFSRSGFANRKMSKSEADLKLSDETRSPRDGTDIVSSKCFHAWNIHRFGSVNIGVQNGGKPKRTKIKKLKKKKFKTEPNLVQKTTKTIFLVGFVRRFGSVG